MLATENPTFDAESLAGEETENTGVETAAAPSVTDLETWRRVRGVDRSGRCGSFSAVVAPLVWVHL